MSVGPRDVDGRTPVELDHRPASTSGIVALTAGVLAMLASAPFAGVALPFGLAGVLFLATGLFVTGSRSWVSLGVTSIFVGVLVVGILGTVPPLVLLVSVVGLVVSWDVGRHAITVGEQFGRTAPTRRGELVHAAGSSLVGVLAAGGAYGAYSIRVGEQPALAVVLLITGVILLVWVLRE